MEAWEWIALAAALAFGLVVLVLATAYTIRRRRRTHLRERFGGEYERAVAEAGKRSAERQLVEVERRHDDLEIRQLPATTRERYLEEWRQTEARFVSDPPDAVRGAERIVLRVLEDRGYPVDGDLDDRVTYVAADYPDAVRRYRHAHELQLATEQSTEHLRRAMIDLRMVLDELLVRERATA